jgi:hypothetical protein
MEVFASCQERIGRTLSAAMGGLNAAKREFSKVVTLCPAALKSEIMLLNIPKPSLKTSDGIDPSAKPPPEACS